MKSFIFFCFLASTQSTIQKQKGGLIEGLDNEADLESLMNKYEDFDKKPEESEDVLATAEETGEEENKKDY